MSEAPTRQPLSGGVSCEVWIERDALGREVVVKQPLSKLKVTAEWHSNPERFEVEARALEAIRELLGSAAAPKVLWVDAAQRRFAMERIPERFRNWKQELLACRVDLVTARRVGELLGQLHARSSKRSELARDFATREYFEELRIEPFFSRVAAKNVALALDIEKAIDALREPGTALVHGDFSPKNLLVDGGEVVILDLEILHFGNPRFDLAFLLSHLMLKGLRNGVDPSNYRAAIQAAIDGYRVEGPSSVFDRDLTRILGCLLLARFEGASPVDYREQLDAGQVKAIASEFITRPTEETLMAIDQALCAKRANV